MPGWEQLGMQAASDLQAGVFGLALGSINDKRQLKQQGKLQKMEIAGQKQLTDYNFLKQMEMWDRTNYAAQMGQLAKAGLNPALIYGAGGQSGASTNVETSKVTGGTAPAGGQEIQTMMAMGLQRNLQTAQIENIKAQTEKTKAETQAVQPAIEKTTQETVNLKTQNALDELERAFQESTFQNRESLINLSLSKLLEEVKIIENDRQISDATKNDQITKIKRQTLQVYLENELIKSQKHLTDQQKKVAEQQIESMVAHIIQNQKHLQIEDLKARIMETDAFRNAQQQGDVNIQDLLRNIGIFLPFPAGKTHTPVRGFQTQR